jgi:dihydropteroate synthase
VTTIVGILNCTPDSFSDGDPDATEGDLYERAEKLIDQGADIIDIGGDSTRPGSQCVGVEEEWSRIGRLIERVAHRIPVSVDTHKAEVARRAIRAGARYINDVGGASDHELVSVIAESQVSYIFMYSASEVPHVFVDGPARDQILDTLNNWIKGRISALTSAGIPSDRLIADTGMGAFVSRDPDVSLEILKRYGELQAPGGGLMFGCSRKGFLKRGEEESPSERDPLSSLYGALAVAKRSLDIPVYLRVHNVALQRNCIDTWRRLMKCPPAP